LSSAQHLAGFDMAVFQRCIVLILVDPKLRSLCGVSSSLWHQEWVTRSWRCLEHLHLHALWPCILVRPVFWWLQTLQTYTMIIPRKEQYSLRSGRSDWATGMWHSRGRPALLRPAHWQWWEEGLAGCSNTWHTSGLHKVWANAWMAKSHWTMISDQ